MFTCLSLFVCGYIIGYNIAILIILFGLLGFVNALIFMLPLEMLGACLLVVVAAIAIKKCLIIKRYGCVYWNNNCGYNYKKVFMFLFVLGILFLTLKYLYLPIIRITIIVK